MSSTPPPPSAFGTLVRHWRNLRGLTQLSLAVRMETTTRHLSYLENGRSRPGRDVVLRLGEALDLPLRTRNDLLVAAGLAPEFPASELHSPALAPYRQAVLQMIAAIHPFPAFVVDAKFSVKETNEVGRRLLPSVSSGEGVNLVDALLGPGPAREMIANFAEVAWSLHTRLVRATSSMTTPEVLELRARIEEYLRDVPRPPAGANGDPVICPTFKVGDVLVRTIGMTMRFGPSRDVMLEELSVDVLCPRDELAARFFQDLATKPAGS